MLEIVFAEGAAGSLAIAMGKGEYIGGASSLVVLRDSEDGEQPGEEEELEILRQFEERERRGWEQAVPLEGSRRDILCFSLALSVGEINEDGIGEKRKAALSQLLHVYPRESEQAVRDLLGSARESLQLLQQESPFVFGRAKCRTMPAGFVGWLHNWFPSVCRMGTLPVFSSRGIWNGMMEPPSLSWGGERFLPICGAGLPGAVNLFRCPA